MAQPVFTAQGCRERDVYAMESLHIPSLLLMEHAAAGIVRHIPAGRTLFLCGPGNNGQDGLAAARLLFMQRQDVACLILSEKGLGVQLEMARALDIPVHVGLESAASLLSGDVFVVDALFGSGLNRDVSGEWAVLVDLVNASGHPVLSVDVPSGLDGTSGQVRGTCVCAGATVCLDAMKTGLLLDQGPVMAGRVFVEPIGIPEITPVLPAARLLDQGMACACLPVRDKFGHKGSAGKALVAGGSADMAGALYFCGKACFSAGVGLLYVDCPDACRSVMQTLLPEGILASVRSDAGRMDAVCIGNGMGKTNHTCEVVTSLLTGNVPLVVDADGLWNLDLDLLVRDAPLILLPHLREFAGMTGLPLDVVKRNPMQACRDFCARHSNVVLVLKSEITWIGMDSRLVVLDRPDSALAKGGSGDVLAGIITSFLAQCHDPWRAAVAGVWVHNAAAQFARSPFSFSPQDLAGHLGDVFAQMEKMETV